MEVEKALRYRVNVATSVKGVKTWDCTVDFQDVQGASGAISYDAAIHDMETTLKLSDRLVTALENRYPVALSVYIKGE